VGIGTASTWCLTSKAPAACRQPQARAATRVTRIPAVMPPGGRPDPGGVTRLPGLRSDGAPQVHARPAPAPNSGPLSSLSQWCRFPISTPEASSVDRPPGPAVSCPQRSRPGSSPCSPSTRQRTPGTPAGPGSLLRFWIIDIDGQRVAVAVKVVPGRTAHAAEFAHMAETVRFVENTG